MVIRRKTPRVSAPDRAAEAHLAQLQAFLDDARNFAGVEPATVPGLRVRTTEDERIFLCIRGVFLFETNLDLTEPEDARQSQPPAPIDRGELAVTNTRAVFTGSKQIRQWAWPHIIGIAHAPKGSWTVLDVSSRRRQFGVLYDDENREQIRFSLDLAAASAGDGRDGLIRRLSEEIASVVSASPGLGTIRENQSPEDAPDLTEAKVSNDE